MPVKAHKGSEENLDMILSTMQEMKKDMQRIRNEQREYIKVIKILRRENMEL